MTTQTRLGVLLSGTAPMLLVALSASCTTETTRSPETQIYRAILSDAEFIEDGWRPPRPILVVNELASVEQLIGTDPTSGLHEIGATPDVLRVFRRVTDIPGAVPGDISEARRADVVTKPALDAAWWKSFPQSHPGRRGVVTFSQIALNSDRTEAVVIASLSCGGWCLQAAGVRLRVSNGRWQIVGRRVFRIG